jgi:hypothetical protein
MEVKIIDNIKKISDIPIVLHSMDSYSSYWDNWYILFKKYVKNHGPIYFLTEDKAPSFSNEVIHIKTGTEEWGYRLLNGLSQIESDLIFYMQEDFWAVKDITLTDDFLELFKQYEMNCLKICLNSPLISIQPITNILYKYNQDSEYTLSHQFALWDKKYFMDNIYPFESPWSNEIYGSERINKTNHKIYYIDNYWYEPVCRRGVLQPIGYDILKTHNLEFYGK